ncbi:MAG: hypothetical protein ACSW8C_00520 [bacterium]
MSINPVSPATPTAIPSVEDDILPEDVKRSEGLSYEERHKNLVDTNTRYIWEQMNRSTQRFTQEMIRQAREQQKEDEMNS